MYGLDTSLTDAASWYSLDDPENISQRDLFLNATGISDPAELKAHILEVQKEAYAVYPYRCICGLRFLLGKTRRHPAYPKVRELGSKQAAYQPILIDLGCFSELYPATVSESRELRASIVGCDASLVVYDGYPADAVIGTDLNTAYFSIGDKLFKSAPGDPLRPPLVAGDIFSPSFLDINTSALPSTDSPRIDLGALTSLTPLRGRCRVITAHSFFHLFLEDKQLELAKRCAFLLDERPGSMVLGSHWGMKIAGCEQRNGSLRFMHSPESWAAMWKKVLGDKVRVQAHLMEVSPKDLLDSSPSSSRTFLIWSVERM